MTETTGLADVTIRPGRRPGRVGTVGVIAARSWRSGDGGGEEMTDPARVRRHAERVRELVASVVRKQIKDPRLGMITITDARITADLRDATVFYTVLGDAAARANTAAALASANGLLRSTAGKATGLRH